MYEGEWLDDKRCGQGMLRLRKIKHGLLLPFLANENRYEGGWVDDMKNGKGKFIYHKTDQVMEGVWIDNIARVSQVVDLGPRQIPTKTTYPIPEVSYS